MSAFARFQQRLTSRSCHSLGRWLGCEHVRRHAKLEARSAHHRLDPVCHSDQPDGRSDPRAGHHLGLRYPLGGNLPVHGARTGDRLLHDLPVGTILLAWAFRPALVRDLDRPRHTFRLAVRSSRLGLSVGRLMRPPLFHVRLAPPDSWLN